MPTVEVGEGFNINGEIIFCSCIEVKSYISIFTPFAAFLEKPAQNRLGRCDCGDIILLLYQASLDTRYFKTTYLIARGSFSKAKAFKQFTSSQATKRVGSIELLL